MQAYLKCEVLQDEGEIDGKHVIKVSINKSNTFKNVAMSISVFDDELYISDGEPASNSAVALMATVDEFKQMIKVADKNDEDTYIRISRWNPLLNNDNWNIVWGVQKKRNMHFQRKAMKALTVATDTRLRSCPFCGGKAYLSDTQTSRKHFFCNL